MKRLSKVLSFLLLAILVAAPVYAQQTGSISGKVLGRDGQPAANIQVKVDQLYTNNGRLAIRDTQVIKTGRNGEYGLSGIQNGRIMVTVLENGQSSMVQGEKVGDEIYIANGLDKRIATFDLSKAPAAAPAVAAAAPSNLSAADREALKKKYEAEAAAAGEANKAFDAGKAAYLAKDFPEAVKQFKAAAEKQPSQDVIWANLGQTYNALKQYDDAIAAYTKATELKPIESNYYMNLSLAQIAAGKIEESKTAIEKAASLNPANAGQAYYNLGVSLINLNKPDDAIPPFKKAIELAPTYAPAYYRLGMTLVQKGQLAEAPAYFQKCVDLGASCPEIDTAKAVIVELGKQAPTTYQSDAAKAKAEAEKAKASQPAKGKTKN